MRNGNGKIHRVMVWACLAVVLMVAGIGALLYGKGRRVITVAAEVSPDGGSEVILQQIGDPDFPFGNTHGKLLLKENNRQREQITLSIANDGKTLSEGNWRVTWQIDAVTVIIMGEEQEPVTYHFTLDGSGKSGNR